jgi:hypothetical protein
LVVVALGHQPPGTEIVREGAAYLLIEILRPVPEEPQDVAALKKARSLLLILLATCKETLLALEAAANILDSQLTDDLRAMIERSEDELRVLDGKIRELVAS